VAVRLVLFAAAREAAGRRADTFDLADAPTLDALLQRAVVRYGERFEAVLASSRVWHNGDDPPRGAETRLRDGDEVAVLPPVSGGSDGHAAW
jgi:MoaD family protein